MSWDAFAATVLPKHAAFEAAWTEAEEQWADRLFSLRGTDPLFAPKGEFETEEDHRTRRGQALDAARKQRKELFADLEAQRTRWLTTPHSVLGTLTLNPDRYDAERELSNYTLHSGPDDGGVQREGWWAVSPEEAANWSEAHPPGTAELVLDIVWTSSGIPQIIRAEGAGFKLEPQGWVHVRQDLHTENGWAWYDRGLLSGPFQPEARPWRTDASGIPTLQQEKFNISLVHSTDRTTLAKIKDQPSWSQGANATPEDITLFMDGMEFNVTGWREIHAMDIQDEGAGLLISGAVQQMDDQRPYFRWACMAVDRDSRLGQARLARRFGQIPAASRTHRAHPTEHLRCQSPRALGMDL